MNHFQEHRSDNKHLTLIQFLAEHYGGDTHQKEDWQKDSKLPFKTFQNDFNHIQWIEPQNLTAIPVYFSVWMNSLNRSLNQDSLPDDRTNTIWHPPKFFA